jgi:hypothetical protein
MKKLQEVKRNAVMAILPRWNHVPEPYWGTICAFPMSYSVGKSIVSFCQEVKMEPGRSRILIIGAHGGRDYHWLTGFGFKVDVLDLGHHSWGESDYVGDSCRSETWKQITVKYDLVLMHDILEHLPEDFAALCHARTVLSDDGHLFLSVPYKHDPEITHVRSYSKMTLNRLLTLAGYSTTWTQDRPGLLEAFPRLVNIFNYGLALLMPTVRMSASLLHALLKVEYLINERTRGIYRILGHSPQKGITLAARAVAQSSAQDYVEFNKKMFIR